MKRKYKKKKTLRDCSFAYFNFYGNNFWTIIK